MSLIRRKKTRPPRRQSRLLAGFKAGIKFRSSSASAVQTDSECAHPGQRPQLCWRIVAPIDYARQSLRDLAEAIRKTRIRPGADNHFARLRLLAERVEALERLAGDPPPAFALDVADLWAAVDEINQQINTEDPRMEHGE